MTSLTQTLNKILNPSFTAPFAKWLDAHVTPGSKHFVVVLGALLIEAVLTVSHPVIDITAAVLLVGYALKEVIEVMQGAELTRSIFDVLWAIAAFLVVVALGIV